MSCSLAIRVGGMACFGALGPENRTEGTAGVVRGGKDSLPVECPLPICKTGLGTQGWQIFLLQCTADEDSHL